MGNTCDSQKKLDAAWTRKENKAIDNAKDLADGWKEYCIDGVVFKMRVRTEIGPHQRTDAIPKKQRRLFRQEFNNQYKEKIEYLEKQGVDGVRPTKQILELEQKQRMLPKLKLNETY
ncbi:MAG: hypothetical protein GY759_09065 [Chloroflexi bacterium]|nr:hypothetical protein [Chloroflexota bacterium]